MTPEQKREKFKSLPKAIQQAIENFKMETYASKYYSGQVDGVFKKNLPIEKLMNWQKDTIKTPMLNIDKALHKDALKCFKIIQKIMDEAKVTIAARTLEIQTLVEKGIQSFPLRDEIYVQLIKQLSENPNEVAMTKEEYLLLYISHSSGSLFKGWQTLSIVSQAFPPSKILDNYLRAFVQIHFSIENPLLDKISRYCFKVYNKASKSGPRGKTFTINELNFFMVSNLLGH